MLLEENLRRVEQNIEAAAERGEHAAEAVTLLAVSKTKPASAIRELYEAGQRDFGENYVQELREKAAELPKDIRWHMIGHLQRNKVKYIAEYVSMIHSVDSLALAETIEKEAAKYDRIIPVLVEVNVAGEDTKFGVLPEDADALVRQISALPHVAVRGYMTSAPYTDTLIYPIARTAAAAAAAAAIFSFSLFVIFALVISFFCYPRQAPVSCPQAFPCSFPFLCLYIFF